MECSVSLDQFKIGNHCSALCRTLPAPMSRVQKGHPVAEGMHTADFHFLIKLNINKPCQEREANIALLSRQWG